ncbi:hypothetical protein Tsubulata_023190, partial [Turnera subulata]
REEGRFNGTLEGNGARADFGALLLCRVLPTLLGCYGVSYSQDRDGSGSGGDGCGLRRRRRRAAGGESMGGVGQRRRED